MGVAAAAERPPRGTALEGAATVLPVRLFNCDSNINFEYAADNLMTTFVFSFVLKH